jgi:hypothetical protein
MDTLPPELTIEEPAPKQTRIPWLGAVGAVGAAVAVIALAASLALYVASRSGGSASPGVANVGPTPTAAAATSRPPQGKSMAAALAYSVCMRAHGVPDFPDPNSQGGISIDIRAGSHSDLDPNSPQSKAAQTACQKLRPGGNMTPAQMAQARAQALQLSSCMRAHGIKDFPDPNSQGQMAIRGGLGSDLDPNSPPFQAAQKACQSVMPGGGKMQINGGPGGPGKSSSGGGGQ